MNRDPACYDNGAFALTVLIKAQALLDRIPVHPEARLLAVLSQDGLPETCLGFSSIESLKTFISEHHPFSVAVAGAPSEESRALMQALHGDVHVH